MIVHLSLFNIFLSFLFFYSRSCIVLSLAFLSLFQMRNREPHESRIWVVFDLLKLFSSMYEFIINYFFFFPWLVFCSFETLTTAVLILGYFEKRRHYNRYITCCIIILDISNNRMIVINYLSPEFISSG